MRIPIEKLSLAIINANSFYEAGLAAREDDKEEDLSVSDMLFKAIPATVNFCFSAELFLKAIISQFGLEFDKTHNLRKLFDVLPSGLQKGLGVAYGMIPGTNARFFVDNIDSISNSFAELRYFGINAFEEKQIKVPFLFAYQFATIIKELVLSINKKTAELIKSF